MSAYICSDRTTNALAQLASPDDAGSRQRIVDVLRAENTRSVNFRYQRNDDPSPIVFKHSDAVLNLTTAEIVKLCNHFDYQSCETRDYQDSEAARIVEGIRRRAAKSAIDSLLVRHNDALGHGRRVLSDEMQSALMNCTSDEWVNLLPEALPEYEREYEAAPWGL